MFLIKNDYFPLTGIHGLSVGILHVQNISGRHSSSEFVCTIETSIPQQRFICI